MTSQWLAARADRDIHSGTLHLDDIRDAAAIFPLDYRLRRKAADELIINADLVPPFALLAEIERALQADPWSSDLLRDRADIRRQLAERQEAH